MQYIKITPDNRLEPQNADYLEQYYAVRSDAFENQLGTAIYKPNSTDHDKDPTTIFLLAVTEENKVAGGVQLLVSSPSNRKRLRFELSHDVLKIENLLPHMDTSRIIVFSI